MYIYIYIYVYHCITYIYISYIYIHIIYIISVSYILCTLWLRFSNVDTECGHDVVQNRSVGFSVAQLSGEWYTCLYLSTNSFIY